MSAHRQPDQCNAELRFVRPDFATAPRDDTFGCSCGLLYKHDGHGTWTAVVGPSGSFLSSKKHEVTG